MLAPKSSMVLIAFAMLACVTGCGPAAATVSGEVTVDGKPVEIGSITISVGDDVSAPPVTAELKNGKYELRTVAGKKLVGISAFKKVGERKESDAPNSPMVPITEELITKTGLALDVVAGANSKDWKLESKAK
jgi:hypothetical protein